MTELMRHHHFKAAEIPTYDGLSRLEARVVSLLLETKVPDADRDSSVAWELKHQAGITQCARILAQRRGLDQKVAAAGALLHDVAAIVTGSYVEHARAGGPIARELLNEVGGFTAEEIAQVLRVVVDHSDKDLLSDDPWSEFGKDADILDCFLYPDAIDEYLLIKPWSKVFWYFKRGQSVWSELGLPTPAALHSLDEWQADPWLLASEVSASAGDLEALDFTAFPAPSSPVALYRTPDGEPGLATSPANAAALALALTPVGQVRPASPPDAAADCQFFWPALSRWQTVTGDALTSMIRPIDGTEA